MNANGVPFERTIAVTVAPGITLPMTKLVPVPTVGEKMELQEYATTNNNYALLLLCGTDRTLF